MLYNFPGYRAVRDRQNFEPTRFPRPPDFLTEQRREYDPVVAAIILHYSEDEEPAPGTVIADLIDADGNPLKLADPVVVDDMPKDLAVLPQRGGKMLLRRGGKRTSKQQKALGSFLEGSDPDGRVMMSLLEGTMRSDDPQKAKAEAHYVSTRKQIKEDSIAKTRQIMYELQEKTKKYHQGVVRDGTKWKHPRHCHHNTRCSLQTMDSCWCCWTVDREKFFFDLKQTVTETSEVGCYACVRVIKEVHADFQRYVSEQQVMGLLRELNRKEEVYAKKVLEPEKKMTDEEEFLSEKTGDSKDQSSTDGTRKRTRDECQKIAAQTEMYFVELLRDEPARPAMTTPAGHGSEWEDRPPEDYDEAAGAMSDLSLEDRDKKGRKKGKGRGKGKSRGGTQSRDEGKWRRNREYEYDGPNQWDRAEARSWQGDWRADGFHKRKGREYEDYDPSRDQERGLNYGPNKQQKRGEYNWKGNSVGYQPLKDSESSYPPRKYDYKSGRGNGYGEYRRHHGDYDRGPGIVDGRYEDPPAAHNWGRNPWYADTGSSHNWNQDRREW